MYDERSSIATVELHETPCWIVVLKNNATLSSADIDWLYRYIQGKGATMPVLMDWRTLQGIVYDALEEIVRCQTDEFPLTVIADPGSIGERYAHLVGQLCEAHCSCVVFRTIAEATGWIAGAMKKEP